MGDTLHIRDMPEGMVKELKRGALDAGMTLKDYVIWKLLGLGVVAHAFALGDSATGHGGSVEVRRQSRVKVKAGVSPARGVGESEVAAPSAGTTVTPTLPEYPADGLLSEEGKTSLKAAYDGIETAKKLTGQADKEPGKPAKKVKRDEKGYCRHGMMGVCSKCELEG